MILKGLQYAPFLFFSIVDLFYEVSAREIKSKVTESSISSDYFCNSAYPVYSEWHKVAWVSIWWINAGSWAQVVNSTEYNRKKYYQIIFSRFFIPFFSSCLHWKLKNAVKEISQISPV